MTDDQRKSLGAKCGHVKRRLNRGERLEGTVLEFALSVIEPDASSPKSDYGDFLSRIAEKLKAGEQLDDYEHHIVVDVVLLHTRLGAG